MSSFWQPLLCGAVVLKAQGMIGTRILQYVRGEAICVFLFHRGLPSQDIRSTPAVYSSSTHTGHRCQVAAAAVHGGYNVQTGGQKSIAILAQGFPLKRPDSDLVVHGGRCHPNIFVAHPQCTPRARIRTTGDRLQQLLRIEAPDGIKKRK